MTQVLTATQKVVTQVRTAVNDDKVVVFNLMINCMSAERQFDLTKLGFDVNALPSEARKLVQERIFPKDFLTNYTRLRDRANAVLDRGAAVRLEMGTISSLSEAVAKVEDLDLIQADWEAQLKKDKVHYEDICNNRILKIANQALKEGVSVLIVNSLVDSLKKRQPTWDDFVQRMNFKYIAIPTKLELDENNGGFNPTLFKAQRDGMVALREGVFGALVHYLTRESNDILKVLNDKKPVNGCYTINYRTVTRIAVITEKLHGLAFVHKHVGPLASIIDEALRFMPKSVEKDLPLPSGQFLNLLACLDAMTDQHRLTARLRDKQPLVEVFQQPILAVGVPAAVVAPVAAAPAVVQQVAAPVAAVSAPQQSAAPALVTEAVTAPAVTVEAETEASPEVEVEAEPAGNSPFGHLGFMGASLFE